MKTLFTLIFIAFFSLQNALAQTEKAVYEPWVPVRAAGIKGGVNVASVSNLASSNAYLGFHAGFFGEVQARENFGYGGEIIYSKQGVTVSNIDFGLDYFSLPLFLNLYHGKITVQGGGYAAVLFMATARFGQEKDDITDYFQNTDFGLLAGLKYRPSSQTFISARYLAGMQNINDHFTKRAEAIIQNRNIQVSAGYQF